MGVRVRIFALLGLWFTAIVMSLTDQVATVVLARDSSATSAPTGAAAAAPIGWLYLCGEQPAECNDAQLMPTRVVLSTTSWAELDQINRLVNLQIVPISDEQHYAIYRLGIVNWWTYPDDGKGNCNDYVLLKRKLLIEAGWPKSALLMTIVRDQSNSGHLVLMVRSDRGDFILDNLNNEIVRWNKTGYRFVKRQSQLNHNRWVNFDMSVVPQ